MFVAEAELIFPWSVSRVHFGPQHIVPCALCGTAIPVCLRWADFLRHGTFSANKGEVLGQ